MSTEKLDHSRRLKKVREELLKVSQLELARKLSISANKIKDVEAGKTKISIELATRLEEKFQVDFRWLLTGKGKIMRHLPTSKEEERHAINTKVLQNVIQAVDTGLAKKDLTLHPRKKSELIALLYDYCMQTNQDAQEEIVEQYLTLAS